MAIEKIRGSQKLMNALASEGELPSVESIKKALALPASSEIKILRWHPIGIPPVYRAFNVVLEAPVMHMNDVLHALIGLNDTAVHFKIFPYGVPTIDKVNIAVTSGEF